MKFPLTTLLFLPVQVFITYTLVSYVPQLCVISATAITFWTTASFSLIFHLLASIKNVLHPLFSPAISLPNKPEIRSLLQPPKYKTS